MKAHVSERKTPSPLLWVLLSCSFLGSFGQSMMNSSLHEVADLFSLSLSIANWLVVGYMVVAAVSIMLAAFLLKRWGARRVFFIGIFSMAAGSIIALVSSTFEVLILARLLQAVGTGLFYPLVTSLLMSSFSQEKVGSRLALNSCFIALGLGLGPVFSGLILTYFGWGYVFVMPLVLALVVLCLGWFFIHGEKTPGIHTFDVLSVLLGLFGLGLLMYGLGEITYTVLSSALALGAGLVFLILFVWRQLALDDPLLNLSPLRQWRFSLGIVLVMVGMMLSYSLSVLLLIYYEGVEGLSSFHAGLVVLVPLLFNALCTFLSGKIYDKRGVWPLVFLGFTAVIIGQGIAFGAAESLMMGVLVVACVLIYSGLGFIVSPSKTTALKQLTPDLYPHGAAINSSAIQIAAATGASLFVGVLSSITLKETELGMSESAALNQGFIVAILLAAIVASIGCVGAVVYTRLIARQKQA